MRMTKNLANRAIFALVLTATAFSTAAAAPAHAQSPAGKLGNEFTDTYYANAALTGEPVGGFTYGYCPTYFSSSWGTRTVYFVSSEEPC
jgi:hypothetical protein